MHPGTNVTMLDRLHGFRSLIPLWAQVHKFRQDLDPIMAANPGGINLLGKFPFPVEKSIEVSWTEEREEGRVVSRVQPHHNPRLSHPCPNSKIVFVNNNMAPGTDYDKAWASCPLSPHWSIYLHDSKGSNPSPKIPVSIPSFNPIKGIPFRILLDETIWGVWLITIKMRFIDAVLEVNRRTWHGRPAPVQSTCCQLLTDLNWACFPLSPRIQPRRID